MLIVDRSAVKLPGEAKQNNPPHECGQLIDAGEGAVTCKNAHSRANAEEDKDFDCRQNPI
jgi:hypothetical protein